MKSYMTVSGLEHKGGSQSGGMRVCTVSVVIPTYNRAHVVGRAIRSVLNQIYQDFEIIVVDDGSTDNTEEVVNCFNDPRICYIRHEQNKGGSAARNTGISMARGKYIAFLDSDDEWLPSKLEKQVKQLDEAPACVGLSYTGYWVIRGGITELGRIPSARGYVMPLMLARDCVSPTSTVLVKAECFRKVGGFDPELPARQDYDMWFRIAAEYHFEVLTEPLVRIYRTDDSITHNVSARLAADLHMLSIVMEKAAALGMSKHQQRRLYAFHYYDIGRYCQKHRNFGTSIHFLARAIVNRPLWVKAWVAIIAAMLGLRLSGPVTVKLKNFARIRLLRQGQKSRL